MPSIYSLLMNRSLPYKVGYIKVNNYDGIFTSGVKQRELTECTECRRQIEVGCDSDGETMINIKIATCMTSGTFDGIKEKWFHVECFFKLFHEVKLYEISNIDNIRWEDQKLIRKRIGEDTSFPEIEKQNADFFKLRDELKKLKNAELIRLMEHNEQYLLSKQKAIIKKQCSDFDYNQILSDIRDQVADRMLFGSLQPCKKCDKNIVIFEPGIGYKCLAYLSIGTVQCLYVTDDPKRCKFKLIDEMKNKYGFLGNYEPKIEKRIIQVPPTEDYQYSGQNINENNTSNEIIILRSNNELELSTCVYEDGGVKKSIMLVQTNIQFNENKYYHLEIRKHKRNKTCWLLRKWGRIGTFSREEMVETMKLEECLKKYEELYLQRKKNYTELEKDTNFHDKIDKVTKVAKKPIKNFMKLIYDKNILKEEFRTYGIDLERIPIGKVSENQINKAENVLEELKRKIDDDTLPNRIFHLIDKSNKFYSLIPHAFGYKRPPIIDDLTKYKKEVEELKSLKEMTVPCNFNNPQVKGNRNLLEIFYRKLNVEIEVLQDHDYFKIIKQYLENTHDQLGGRYKIEMKIKNIYFLKKHGNYHDEYEEHSTNIENKKWLWHGTNLINIASILKNGLKIMPLEAHITGSLLGKGIYFSDVATKAAIFSGTKNKNPTGVLLLCEVALGTAEERFEYGFIDELPDQRHSVIGKGRIYPDSNNSFKIPEGVEVPYGRLIFDQTFATQFDHNMYVVYNPNQVKIKYLVEVQFINYKVNDNYRNSDRYQTKRARLS